MNFEKTITVLSEYLNRENDTWWVEGITDKPSGNKQKSDCSLFEHEFVAQTCGACGDDYSGSIYFPLSSGKYLKIGYTC